MPARSSNGWIPAAAEIVTLASDFAGTKKPLILKGFHAFGACEPRPPKLNSTHRKYATATAKGFANGQRKEPLPSPTDRPRPLPDRLIRVAHPTPRIGAWSRYARRIGHRRGPGRIRFIDDQFSPRPPASCGPAGLFHWPGVNNRNAGQSHPRCQCRADGLSLPQTPAQARQRRKTWQTPPAVLSYGCKGECRI